MTSKRRLAHIFRMHGRRKVNSSSKKYTLHRDMLMMKRLYWLLLFFVFLEYCGAFPYIINTPDIDIWNETSDDEMTRNARVLNFFPVPVEEECKANDGRRSGICMNTYECRMQGGASYGSCALGFGVCCVFTVTCSQDAYNNLTYFVNPHFPDLSRDSTTCRLKIRKLDSEIAQFKLDFIHFNLGQPNRRTGICDEDYFQMEGGGGKQKQLQICGINSGQHVYFDVDQIDDAIEITMNLSKRTVGRMWEVKITQIPFMQRAPSGCMQYHTGQKGLLQTMNFAENGRLLANQDYNICMRQEEGMCSIIYEPCHDNSFRIGTNKAPDNSTQPVVQQQLEDDVGSGDGIGGTLRAMDDDAATICGDKIVLPCDSEDLLMPSDAGGTGFCSLSHCGDTLCPMGEHPCRLESSVTPFTIGVHFGMETIGRERSTEDYLGMCLTYEQQPCLV